MENQTQKSDLTPYTLEDFSSFGNATPKPDDVLQLDVDTLNVLEKRVPISTFDQEYQQRIKNHYRFSALRYPSKTQIVSRRSKDTLDIV